MTSSGGARANTGTYVRLSEIASGGMGSVELAMRREGSFRRLFAVKRLLAGFRDDPDVRSMFIDEARIAGLLRHPNVVSVVDVGEDETGPFLVMDYVEGLSLGSIMSRLRSTADRIDVQVAARIIAQCAHGLHAAHELRGHDGTHLQLVHRDVSPQNILVGFDGVVRLTDFGIAKAAGRATRTSTGLLKGKLSYMAPEQLRFEEPDRRSDLFALGVVFHELVSGTRLFKAETPRDAARRILNEDAPDLTTLRPDVPPELAALVSEMLARDPARRPAEAASVAQRLETIASTLAQREGPRDVAGFMRERFAQAGEESARRIAEAIATVESRRDLRIGDASSKSDEVEVDVEVGATVATPLRAGGKQGGAPRGGAPEVPVAAPGRRPLVAWAALAALAAVALSALAWAGIGAGGASEPAEVVGPVAAPPTPEPAEVAGRAEEPASQAAEAAVAIGTEGAEQEASTGADRDGPEPATRAAPRRSRSSDEGTRRRSRRWDWE